MESSWKCKKCGENLKDWQRATDGLCDQCLEEDKKCKTNGKE